MPAGTRGLLRENVAQRDRTAAYRCSRTHGLPCAVVGRLMPCSPGSRIPSGLPHLTEFADTGPVGADAASARLGRSDDGRDHTVLPYASIRLRQTASPDKSRFAQRALRASSAVRTTRLASRSRGSAQSTALPCASHPRRHRSRPPQPDPRLVTTYDRPFSPDQDGRHVRQNRISVKRNILFRID